MNGAGAGCAGSNDLSDLAPEWDVLVVGGGPAGCATARALRRGNAELRVLVVDARRHDEFRMGETLAPNARAPLAALGLLDSFTAEGHLPCHGSASSWGDSRLGYSDSIFNPYGHGWHLDRRRFDRFMAAGAISSGAVLCSRTRLAAARPEASGYRLELATDQGRNWTISARRVVDATGGRAAFGRMVGARRRRTGTLQCRAARFALSFRHGVSASTWLEAAEYGWWYAARLPGQQLLVCLATDPDIARRLGLGRPEPWKELMEETRHIAPLSRAGEFVPKSFAAYAADTGHLDPSAGAGWIAVGDAAMSCDPLLSQGLHNALVSGLDAARRMLQSLERDDADLASASSAIRSAFARRDAQTRAFYVAESRWPAAQFWRRRSVAPPAVPSRMSVEASSSA